MNEQLLANVEKRVCISNRAHADMDDAGKTLNFAGKLEHDIEEQSFYVRVGEDFMAGAMGIGFKLCHVDSLNKMVYGELHIILK